MNSYLVTGSAGFVGFHLAKALLARGEQVLGVDNLNDYYSVQLKQDRLGELTSLPNFSFQKLNWLTVKQQDPYFNVIRLALCCIWQPRPVYVIR